MVLAHIGPVELGPGQTLSEAMIAKVYLQTNVRASQRERGQWGRGQRLILEGPPERLVEALELVLRLVSELVGGEGHGDDEHCPSPRTRLDAWSEAYSDEERAPDQAELAAEERAADGGAEGSHRSEDEAGGDVEEAYRISWLKGYAACQLEFEQ